MLRSSMASRTAQHGMFAIARLLIVYLAAVALRPSILTKLPHLVEWFGRPGSMLTVSIGVGVLITVCVLTLSAEGSYRLVGTSFTIVAVLVTITAVLSLSSYWKMSRRQPSGRLHTAGSDCARTSPAARWSATSIPLPAAPRCRR